jgi:CubicO group peptidase (beta-lactamase class C family)
MFLLCSPNILPLVKSSAMFKLCNLAAPLFLLLFNCDSASSQTITLPLKDSFHSSGLFFLSPEKQLLYYQNIDKILPTNKVEAGKVKHTLAEGYKDFSGFSFLYKDTVRTLSDFMRETRVVGMIVIRNDTILYEKYNEGTAPSTKWINFSIAKSVTSLLYGAALQDGYIANLEQYISYYIPELAGSVYDSVKLRDLLQMSSGVAWNDDPRNPESDLMKLGRMEKAQGWSGAIAYLKSLKRAAAPGQKFNYNTVETSLAGIILKNIIRKPLAQYLSEKIWVPFGMHEDGNWVTNRSIAMENAGCCISATLRDYALLGLFAMSNGKTMDGKQVLPADWMKQATTPAKAYKGYGYYWWLGAKGRYFASGAFGQQIEIDPAQNVVIAIQSHWPVAYNGYYIGYLDSMIEAMMSGVKLTK